jgi:signal transduction histidine kinase
VTETATAFDFSNLSDAALLSDALDCVTYAISVSETGEPRLEWSAGTIHGERPVPLQELLEGDTNLVKVQHRYHAKLAGHLNELLNGNRSEVRIGWRNGSTSFILRDVAQPAFDRQGRVVRIVGAVLHIGDEAWELPHEADALWKERVYDHLDFGLACWNTDGRLVLTNQRFRQFHRLMTNVVRPGVSVRELVVRIARSGEVVITGSRREWIARVLQDFSGGRTSEHLLSDGCWMEIATLRFGEGSILVVRDITAVKGGEDALRQAKEVAESANLKKSRFLRAANHDLRQPLATLKILIYSAFGVEDEKRRQDLLHSMDVTVGIMDEILGSLLQIGQLDAGRIAARISHFQVRQVLEPLAIEFGPQAETKGLSLRMVPSRLTIRSDRALLGRILSNFIANAVRFTETGKVLFGARRRGATLVIEVWDSGCGIAGDEFDLIFEEFHQIATQRRDGQRGLGLGLNIARRLADLLDHEISVRSIPGKGSVFSVTVPCGDVWQSNLGEPEISERIGGEFLGIKVLVIEDNELLRGTVCEMLDRWGVQVTEAADGEKAIKMMEQGNFDFDLALVDFRLPNGRSGTDILKDLRRRSGRNIPGIVATADNDPSLISQIRAEGLPVLIKPVNPARLRSAMHHLLYENDGHPHDIPS